MSSDTIRTKGVLHFTISVRDHEAAAKYYSELIGCEITRINNHFAFMRCGEDHFVLAKMANHVSPNPPRGRVIRRVKRPARSSAASARPALWPSGRWCCPRSGRWAWS